MKGINMIFIRFWEICEMIEKSLHLQNQNVFGFFLTGVVSFSEMSR
jgi:hypothetical protein